MEAKKRQSFKKRQPALRSAAETLPNSAVWRVPGDKDSDAKQHERGL